MPNDARRSPQRPDAHLLEGLLAHVPDVVMRIVLKPKPRFEYVSPSIARLTGYNPEEYYADPSLAVSTVHPDDRPRIQAFFANPDPKAGTPTVRVLHKEGTTAWVEHRFVPVLDSKGKFVAADGVLRDVTDRIRAEQALEASTRDFEHLIGASPNSVVITDTSDAIRYVNGSTLRLHGYSRPAELLGKPLEALFTPSDHVVIRQGWAVSEAQNPLTSTLLVGGLRSNGSTFPAEVRFVSWLAGGVRRRAAICLDLTERERHLGELRMAAAALTSAANGVVITDLDGTIQWVNPAFTQMTGYAPHEVIGRNPRLLRSGKQGREFYENLWNTILSGETWFGQIINKRKDGTLYVEEQTITPVKDEAGKITRFVAIKLDVTQRQLAQDQAAQKLREVVALNRLLQQQLQQRADLARAMSGLAGNLTKLVEQADEALKNAEALGQSLDTGSLPET